MQFSGYFTILPGKSTAPCSPQEAVAITWQILRCGEWEVQIPEVRKWKWLCEMLILFLLLDYQCVILRTLNLIQTIDSVHELHPVFNPTCGCQLGALIKPLVASVQQLQPCLVSLSDSWSSTWYYQWKPWV